MLEFWYSDKCTHQIKLMVCIATCVMIYLCSTVQQLSLMFTDCYWHGHTWLKNIKLKNFC